VSDSLTTPIVQTSTYHFKDTEELIAYQEGRFGSFEYGRYGNPTSRVVEEKLRCALPPPPPYSHRPVPPPPQDHGVSRPTNAQWL
jgi:hypothetical protein